MLAVLQYRHVERRGDRTALGGQFHARHLVAGRHVGPHLHGHRNVEDLVRFDRSTVDLECDVVDEVTRPAEVNDLRRRLRCCAAASDSDVGVPGTSSIESGTNLAVTGMTIDATSRLGSGRLRRRRAGPPAGSVWRMSELSPFALEGGFDPRSAVFDRLLKNRVIMLGSDVNDDIANQICAQLLYLEGEDPRPGHLAVHQQPRWFGHRRHGDLRHDAVRRLRRRHGLPRPRRLDGPVPAHRRRRRQALHAAERPDHDAPAARRPPRSGIRHRHPGRAARATPSCAWPSSSPQHSGQTLEQIQADCERDRWFTAEEAKEYGLVDKVILRRGDIL